MKRPASPPLGGAPRLQSGWDARAAINFMLGGMGSGTVALAALAQPGGLAAAVLFAGGLALVGLGLGSVWLEITQPQRALNVYFNLRRSWMSREALAALLLMPVSLAAAISASGLIGSGSRGGTVVLSGIAGTLGLAFLYCQARILSAARGIPAWRERSLVPLIVATGLTEGAGLLFLLEPWLHAGSRDLLALLGVLALIRMVAWFVYRRRIAVAADPRVVRALRRPALVLLFAGTLLPLVLVALVTGGAITGSATAWVAAVAGACAVASGAFFKFVLLTRTGYTQGIVLPHLPVRGSHAAGTGGKAREATWVQ